jgi:hypothetical protein
MSDQWEQEVPRKFTDYEACPAGNHPGVIIGLLNVGTHDVPTGTANETREVNQLLIVLELGVTKSDGTPFYLGQLFTNSMHDRSGWYKFVCALTGKAFKQGEKFNPTSLLGEPCMVNVLNSTSTSRDGTERTYHKIDSIAAWPKSLPKPASGKPTFTWHIGEHKPLPDLAWLAPIYGKTVEELVSEAQEFDPSHVAAKPAKQDSKPQANGSKGKAKAKKAADVAYSDDDVPF